ncbi:Uncharacterised protein [Candidatus Anstonella stagnisolia]|nr:Uncharacterised protein [Candidatus Anstonella stagnisolia]
MDKKMQDIIEMLEIVTGDTSVPKNIRKALTEARDKLKSNDDLPVKVSSAVYSLDSVSEDINMPMHARTQIWTILSALEGIKTE